MKDSIQIDIVTDDGNKRFCLSFHSPVPSDGRLYRIISDKLSKEYEQLKEITDKYIVEVQSLLDD